MKLEQALVALVGIGNSLAGDDGVGPVVLNRLQELHGDDARLRFLHLDSDLFAVADHLALARHFLFLDAVAGDEPGLIQVSTAYQRGFAASLHQTDLAAVMGSLETLKVADPFPSWEVWGITIEPPQEYREGLSPVVSEAASRLVDALEDHLSLLLTDGAEAVLCSRYP
jgi:hydrogenase maturation protease